MEPPESRRILDCRHFQESEDFIEELGIIWIFTCGSDIVFYIQRLEPGQIECLIEKNLTLLNKFSLLELLP